MVEPWGQEQQVLECLFTPPPELQEMWLPDMQRQQVDVGAHTHTHTHKHPCHPCGFHPWFTKAKLLGAMPYTSLPDCAQLERLPNSSARLREGCSFCSKGLHKRTPPAGSRISCPALFFTLEGAAGPRILCPALFFSLEGAAGPRISCPALFFHLKMQLA